VKARLVIALFSFTLLPLFSTWSITFEDAVFPELATSARALAMGNAFIAKVDDASAVFYNPAGLGTVRKSHFHLSNFQLEANKGWLGAGAGGKFTDAVSNFPKGFQLDGTRELLLDKTPGTISHSRFQALPNFTSRYFSAGYLFAKQTRATLTADAETFEYADRLDHGPYAAFNLSMFGGVVKFGISGILLKRREAIGTADADTAIDLQAADYKAGTGFISTAGFRLTLPINLLPTIAVKQHNVFGQTFSATSGSDGAPDSIKQSIDLGFSVTPQIGNTTRIHFEVNYKDFSQKYSGVSTVRRVVLGMEFDFMRIMFVRFGYGDGFGSAGLGLKTQHVEFDLTTYAVDTSSSSFRGAEDRRFVISLSSGF